MKKWIKELLKYPDKNELTLTLKPDKQKEPMTTKLSTFTDEQLAQELQRRNMETEKISTMPEPLSDIDWAKVIKVCNDYIVYLADLKYYDDPDDKNCIRKVTLEAVFGPGIWAWVKAKIAQFSQNEEN